MIHLDGVTFTYEGSEGASLHDCDLVISRGECIVLCGKSGCGKTTLTKLINGLIPSQVPGRLSGTVRVDDRNIPDEPLWELSPVVGSVFQNPKTQFFNVDTTSELVFGLENRGIPRDEIRRRLDEVVAAYQLESLMDKSVFSLSGGEKQKVAIASAYVEDPAVYVLDEPSANLDHAEILRLQALLRTLKREGKTIIVAEHRVWYLADLLDRAILMDEGSIVREWTQDEFVNLDEGQRLKWGIRSTRPIQSKRGRTTFQDTTGLKVRGLTIRRGKRVLWENLSFQAPRGRAIAICGRNGSGKTTLAQCLCGLRKTNRGQVWLDDVRMTPKLLRKRSFLIMQDVNHQLFGDSVLAEALLGNQASEAEARDALEVMELDEVLDRHPMALSGGQKQRLAVVDGRLCQRDIIVFDEPTSGLDLDNMKRVGGLVRALLREGKVVIIVTHDREFVDYVDADVAF